MTRLIPNRRDLETAKELMEGKTLEAQLQEVSRLWSELSDYPDEQAIMIESCAFWSIGLFAFHYFPEYITAKFGKHHQQILECIERGARGRQVGILAPRGSGKSVTLAVIYPLHCIFYYYAYEALEMQPYHFIIIISKSEDMATERVQSIKNKITMDDNFQHLASGKGVKRFLCNHDKIQVRPKGRGGQIRGSLFEAHRPDLIICDDLDDPETVRNPDVRKKDQTWFDTDLMYAGNQVGSRTNYLHIDTLKHPESTASLLRDRVKWKTMLFRAIEHPADLWHPTHEQQWQQWEKIYTDHALSKQARIDTSTEFYWEHLHETAIDPHVQHLWAESITYLSVRQQICDVGYFPVLRELQNNPHDTSQALFDMETSLRFNIVQEGFLRSDKVLVKWEQMSGATIFLDWAGGRDIAENAYAAVIAVVWCPQPGSREEQHDSLMGGVHGYVLGADIRRIGADRQIAACFEMYDVVKSIVRNRDFNIRLGIEGFVQDTWEAQKQVIERAFIKEREARGVRGLTINWLTRLRNKYDRIDALQPPIRHGWLIFNQGLPNEFYKQMGSYPTGDFLDAPDALEGACQIRISQFESKRRERRDAARKRNQDFKVKI